MSSIKSGLCLDYPCHQSFQEIYRTLLWHIIFLLWVVFWTLMGRADSLAGEGKVSHKPDPVTQGIESSEPGELDDFFEDTPSDKEDDFFSDESETPQIILDTDQKHDMDGKPDPGRKTDTAQGSSPSFFFINGSVTAKMGFRFGKFQALSGKTDHQGLSDFKGELDLAMGTRFLDDWDFLISGSSFYNLAYEINTRDKYTDPFLDEYEKEVELDKLFIRGSLTKDLDIKIGRQIVIWGKSDNIRVTDIFNPLDLREPGMTDIEDLRLPLFMTRMDYYIFDYTFSTFLIHEHRFNKLPVLGSPYYYLPYAIPHGDKLSTRVENTEIAASLSRTFTGSDLSFYLADVYDKAVYINKDGELIHPRVHMAGFAFNKALGNFLLKTEAAVFDKIRLSAYTENNEYLENLNSYSRLDFLAGLEYSGFSNTMVGFEAADQWIIDFDEPAGMSGNKEHRVQYALRISRTFLHEVLEITFLASLYGKAVNDGGFIRAQADYELTDNLELGTGFIFYESGSLPMLRGIGENDRFFASLTYSF
jgi:hypothetical protein